MGAGAGGWDGGDEMEGRGGGKKGVRSRHRQLRDKTKLTEINQTCGQSVGVCHCRT